MQRQLRGDLDWIAMKAMEKADSEAQELSAFPGIRAAHAAEHIKFALRQDDLANAWL